jgi:hypothetical protein
MDSLSTSSYKNLCKFIAGVFLVFLTDNACFAIVSDNMFGSYRARHGLGEGNIILRYGYYCGFHKGYVF